jgi:tRNA acetyltransferase TAN1
MVQFGNEGKWKTTHQQSKERGLQEGVVSPGEIGIWVTCARTQEVKAAREVVAMFDEVRMLQADFIRHILAG